MYRIYIKLYLEVYNKKAYNIINAKVYRYIVDNRQFSQLVCKITRS